MEERQSGGFNLHLAVRAEKESGKLMHRVDPMVVIDGLFPSLEDFPSGQMTPPAY